MTTVVHPGDSLSGRERLVYVLVLGALTALGPFTIDLYLPAFPTLEHDFDVPAALIQLTLTGTTVGFAVGQLIVGPWSDKVGRRLPLILATGLHVVASVGAALSPDIAWLGSFRVLQGFGAAAGGVVAMALVRDLFGGRPLVRMLSRLALVSGLAPVLAPVIGSQLLLIMPWRGIFWVLAGYGTLVIIAVFLWIVETLPKERRQDSGHSTARQRYHAIFSDRVFVGVAIVGGMTFSGLFAYLSASPFLFQQIYSFDAQQYGLLFAVNSLGVVFGVQASSRLTKYVGPQWILAATTIGMLACGVLIVVLDSAGAGLWGILIPLWFFIMCCGFSFPCVQVLGLNAHGHEAGTAASVLGAVNFGMAGIVSPLVGVLGALGLSDAVPMGGIMAVTATISVAALWLVVRPRTVPPLTN
ncbi:multidrug effflux MFS transporter [Microbacterium sp. STN6]|uniref:multidrug effflux MFS transporter n=1 Tax=Microbacterium sp. STN6 TaxID=2995588 RepID=UPI00226085D3|nr:multidrug effflux MFS transporter [Microbacterium sp. STN6]MCX7520839.1 multidrug effflux MFS transporter [Microbacterium sp. STN6]